MLEMEISIKTCNLLLLGILIIMICITEVKSNPQYYFEEPSFSNPLYRDRPRNPTSNDQPFNGFVFSFPNPRFQSAFDDD
ncbi:hypothetical protein SK128_005751 [Halocaridina rubra]|uniref:Uncharacterized protein n=1 Tax=Halocaridina rubra TaxID=373956 RepID=A0AAN9ACV5_HALRR